jgi:hypothetical protein
LRLFQNIIDERGGRAAGTYDEEVFHE